MKIWIFKKCIYILLIILYSSPVIMVFMKLRSLFMGSSMFWVYGDDPETKSFRQFPYNDNPTRAQNTTSLKYCLPWTDAINRRGKFTHAYEGSRSPHASALHWNPPRFRKKIRSDTFLTEWNYDSCLLSIDRMGEMNFGCNLFSKN